jgi:hypothetical protein
LRSCCASRTVADRCCYACCWFCKKTLFGPSVPPLQLSSAMQQHLALEKPTLCLRSSPLIQLLRQSCGCNNCHWTCCVCHTAPALLMQLYLWPASSAALPG